MMALFALLLSCAGSDDASRYVGALQAGADGAPLCEGIRDGALRSDCLSWAARALLTAGRPGEAESACAGLSAGTWRGECFFQLADLHTDPDAALALCDRAGEHAGWCRNHVVRRSLEALVSASGRGEEGETEQAARAAAEGRLGPDDARATARRVVSRHIAARPDDPFDRTWTCGTATARTCAAALEDRILDQVWRGVDDPAEVVARLGPLCAAPISSDEAQGAGLVGWTPQTNAVARRALAGVCARVGRGAADPQQLLRPMPLPAR